MSSDLWPSNLQDPWSKYIALIFLLSSTWLRNYSTLNENKKNNNLKERRKLMAGKKKGKGKGGKKKAC